METVDRRLNYLKDAFSSLAEVFNITVQAIGNTTDQMNGLQKFLALPQEGDIDPLDAMLDSMNAEQPSGDDGDKGKGKEKLRDCEAYLERAKEKVKVEPEETQPALPPLVGDTASTAPSDAGESKAADKSPNQDKEKEKGVD